MEVFQIGQKVLYQNRQGSYEGEIIGQGQENGKLVYDVRLADKSERWGYAEQFKAID